MLRTFGLMIGLAFLMVACGGGSDAAPPPPSTYTVGGTVTGLAGPGLVLQIGGGYDLPVSASGKFTFAVAMRSGMSYTVTVKSSPTSPHQVCTVADGVGTVAGTNVTNVDVTCISGYTIGGTVSGLAGTGLVLQLVGYAQDDAGSHHIVSIPVGPPLQINTNGPFIFDIVFPADFPYSTVAQVSQQPTSPSQNCVIQNADINLTHGNQTDINVTCAPPSTAAAANAGQDSASAYALGSIGGAQTSVAAAAAGTSSSGDADTGQAVGASATAQNPKGWQSIGPAPPTILATIAADAHSHTIYIGTLGGGVIKSTDDGDTFRAVNNGFAGLTISGLAMSPTNPNVVHVNTQFDGFYTTVDGGAHWTGGGWGGLLLFADPNNADVMYGPSGPFDHLLKTTDGGVTWLYADVGLGEAVVFTIAVDPHDSNIVYAGSAGQGAFKSIDAGASWKSINADSNVNAILVDPDNSNIVYVGSDGHGVFKSVNGGRSFVRVGSPRIGSILSLTKSGQTLYAGTATQGVSESVDGGKTWRNSGVSSGHGNVLAVDSRGSVYVGTNFDGAFVRSVSDNGWRRLGWNVLSRCACQNGYAIAIDPSDRDHVLFTTNGGGLLVTDDGGRHWRDGGTEGLTSNGPRGIAFDPRDPRRVYVGSIWGNGLYKSEDRGRHWQRRKFGPADIVVDGIAVDPVDQSVYATTVNAFDHSIDPASNGYGLWKSIDHGDTFTRIDRAPGAPAGVYIGFSGQTVTVDPHHHRTVYFSDNGSAPGLWRSLDAGNTWTLVDASDAFQSVTVDPTNSSIVYASTSGFSENQVLKSVDGGATFSPKSVGLPGGQTANTGFLQIDPNRPNVLYLATEGSALYKSTDAAQTWFPIKLGFGDTHYDLAISGLAMDPESPDTLYAATSYHSVFKTMSGGLPR